MSGLRVCLCLSVLLTLLLSPVALAQEEVETAIADVAEESGSTEEMEAKLDQMVGPLTIAGVKWRDFLGVLSRTTGITFIPSPKVTANVDINFPQKVSLRSILDEFLPLHGLVYRVTPTAIRVMTKEEEPLPEVELQERIFTVLYTTVEKITNAIQTLKTPNGQIVSDPATKQIIVRDTPEALAEMEALVMKLDVQTQMRIFDIKHVDTATVVTQIRDLLSGEKGSIQEDPKTGKIIITDIPEVLERVAQIIAEIDMKTTLTFFKLNFADPQDVIKLAQNFLTKDAYIQYDERTRQIIVDDIPSRLEKVRELIMSLDEPEKVVYIEAEIVDVALTDKMEIGLDWELGKSVDVRSASELIWLEPLLKVINGSASMTYLRPQNYKVAIKALEDTGHAKVLASPRVLVKNNEGAKLQVGTEEPYSVRTTRGYSDDRYGGGDYYTQRTRDVGIILDVEVRINSAGYVEMDVRLENSSAELVNLSGVENSGLRVRKSEVETIAPVKDGRTVVIGGLIEEAKNKSVSGLPWLSRLPIIGWIFGKLIQTNSRHKLLLFITPHIVSIDDPYRYEMLQTEDHMGILKDPDQMDLLPMQEPLTDLSAEYDEDLDFQAYPLEIRSSESVIPLIEEDVTQQGATLRREDDVDIEEPDNGKDAVPEQEPPPSNEVSEGVVVPEENEKPSIPEPPKPPIVTMPEEPLVEKQLDIHKEDLDRIERARNR